jgi:hypothetical protein
MSGDGVAPTARLPVARAPSIYDQLAAPFTITFRDVRGGVELTYITGEQVTSRLNEVLGVENWSFRVLRHDIDKEADEVWVLGELTATIDGVTIVKQQFGSQKLKRSRSTGTALDLGFDLKGASTDAMKKCASLLGIGLYLSKKPEQQRPAAPAPRREWPPRQSASPSATPPVRRG